MANLLLTYCRYYKGEAQNPYIGKDEEHLWDYEQFWCNAMKKKADLSKFIDDYIGAGLAEFCEDDNVPVSLKAIMYNRFAQHNEMFTIEEFKNWYLTYSH